MLRCVLAGGALPLDAARAVVIGDLRSEDQRAFTVRDACIRSQIEIELTAALGKLRDAPPSEYGPVTRCSSMTNDRVLCAYAESVDTTALVFDIVDTRATLFAIVKIHALLDGDHMAAVREHTMALERRQVASCP